MVEHLTFNQRVIALHSCMAQYTSGGCGGISRHTGARGTQCLMTWGFKSLHPHHPKEQCGSSSVVEYHLAKVRVAGSNPVFRSIFSFLTCRGGENGRRPGLKILGRFIPCRFDSGPGHKQIAPVAQLDRAFDYGSKG